jgi:hypothetical protein
VSTIDLAAQVSLYRAAAWTEASFQNIFSREKQLTEDSTMSRLRSKAGMSYLFFLVCYSGMMTGVRADSVTFVSGPSWNVSDAANNPIGAAQYVLLSDTSPVVRPAGATIYNPIGSGWNADLSSIPGAGWIWAPGIIGASPNADLAEYSFSKTFDFTGAPISGSISIAVDDMAQVFVNGNSAGTTGSITDQSVAFQAQSSLSTFDLTPFLQLGVNTIEIVAQNGPGSFGGGPDATYSQNAAGVVFGGSVSFQSLPEPSSIALLGLGCVGVVVFRRIRRR